MKYINRVMAIRNIAIMILAVEGVLWVLLDIFGYETAHVLYNVILFSVAMNIGLGIAEGLYELSE